MNSTSRVVACAVGLLTLASAADSVAADTECKPLFEAMTKLFNTPNHEYLSQTDDAVGKSAGSEIINTGKAMYIKVEGKWHASSETGADLQAQEEQNRKNAKVTICKVVRDESVDGIAATLFSAHTETADGISNEQIWIAKNTGLPLRENIDMDMGAKGGRSRVEIHVVYANVEAPAGLEPGTAAK